MIISKEIKLKLNKPVTNEQIEREFQAKNQNVLRWAITDVDGENFIIRAAVEV